MVGEACALLTLTEAAVRRMPFEVRPWALELPNIEKHDVTKRVPVSVRVADWAVHGLVVDNGRGLVVAERDRLPGHHGLLGLNERSRRAGGWTRIESEPGLGIRVDFRMPVA
jgi:signal transduction histidine kinase